MISGLKASGLRLLAIAVVLASLACGPLFAAEPAGGSPKVLPASNDGELAMRNFRVPAGLQVSLFAAEPLLANPVAFTVDDRGRIFVVETFRLHAGVTDIRGHLDWLDDDLACRTVADRVKMYRNKLGNEFSTYEVEPDRLRRVVDTDGDGQADNAAIMADGFTRAADGLAAGVIARGDRVWFACLPDLWMLRDADDDGQAEERTSLHHGYGVHVGFLGHDLHGLRFGPDGKLYFTIGDRGLHVETPDGVLDYPDMGSVLRCNPDGSQLEVFATGLRNPQELAFDEYGNLFTCDNNSDSGDKARCVYLVEGGDSGWRIGFQFLDEPYSRGPWNAEKLWHPQWEGQAAYLNPPLANLGDGPSGFCYDPGTGLSDKYRGKFFLADFRGSPVNSGVHSFSIKPKGAGFEVADHEQFVWSILCTDVDFGPDGGLYISDWVEGWGLTGKGRIYKVSDPQASERPIVAEVKQLLARGFDQRDPSELAPLLAHADMRVRQGAQFALADQGAAGTPTLREAALRGPTLLSRLHGIWGLGQQAARGANIEAATVALLSDHDAEVRAQAARVAGDVRLAAAHDALCSLLADDSPRVRFHAGIALSKVGRPAAVPALLAMLRDNADRDPHLRHAGAMGLAGAADAEELVALADDANVSAQMGVLLAMRRKRIPEISRFLDAADPRLVEEAARAIYDLPIEPALAALAKTIDRAGLSEVAARRAINANLRLGQAENAAALVRFAARSDASDALRLEAVQCLNSWEKPSGRDRIVGLWRPLEERSTDVVRASLENSSSLGGLLSGGDKVREAGARLCAKHGLKEVAPVLAALAADARLAPSARVGALEALHGMQDERVAESVELALGDNSPAVRAAAQGILADRDAPRALELFDRVMNEGSCLERQAAAATLARLGSSAADARLVRLLDELLAGRLPPDMHLDVLQAAEQRGTPPMTTRVAQYEAARTDQPLGRYLECLQGGDAERGRRIYANRTEASCVRCHKMQGRGSEVGPDLSRIGAEKTRDYLLEAIVAPNSKIAKGYETAVIVTVDGLTHVGVVKGEDAETVRLITAEARTVTIAKADIEEREKGQSAMPEKLANLLSKAELRDLVEYLSQQK